MHNSAAQVYGRTAQQTVNPRDLEADLLMKAAAKLQRVFDDWGNRRCDLEEALLYNRKLWTIFVSSATRPEHPLPGPVKQNIASLSTFIFNRTISIQSDPQPDKLSSLITINREIAAGLRGSS
jgi:flagellar protein FlaF